MSLCDRRNEGIRMIDRYSDESEPLIYNLFPRLVGRSDWSSHLTRAAEMGFRWIYFNPLFYPGFSGSVYAVKTFDRLDPVVFPESADRPGLGALVDVLARARALGLRPMVDLVINHTAKDSPLVTEHPEWYCRDEEGVVQSPFAIDPADARQKTVWGDLAELDHHGTDDPLGLASFIDGVVEECLDVGFEGFRCDAAYKVPAATWNRITSRVRERLPNAMFLAETLGATPEEMDALETAGFDYVMNSSKYWSFDAPWCLEQHEDWQRIAPSVAFPESHDTPRLAAETDGLERVQRQRLLFAATFSEGLLVPVGFEFGFHKQINVVNTRSDDWEQPTFDLCDFIAMILELKRNTPVFGAEGHLEALTPLDGPTLVLEKRVGEGRAILLINKDWHVAQELDLQWLSERLQCAPRLLRPCLDRFEGEEVPTDRPLRLEAAEIAILLPSTV